MKIIQIFFTFSLKSEFNVFCNQSIITCVLIDTLDILFNEKNKYLLFKNFIHRKSCKYLNIIQVSTCPLLIFICFFHQLAYATAERHRN